MAKHGKHQPQAAKPAACGTAEQDGTIQVGKLFAISTIDKWKKSPESVPMENRCRLCWARCKGVGAQQSKDGTSGYYACRQTLTDEPPCGYSWKATIIRKVICVEHREVFLSER